MKYEKILAGFGYQPKSAQLNLVARVLRVNPDEELGVAALILYSILMGSYGFPEAQSQVLTTAATEQLAAVIHNDQVVNLPLIVVNRAYAIVPAADDNEDPVIYKIDDLSTVSFVEFNEMVPRAITTDAVDLKAIVDMAIRKTLAAEVPQPDREA